MNVNPPKFEEYNNQLKPCHKCRSLYVEIMRDDTSIGVICNTCGCLFAADGKTLVSEIVKFWNNYGQDQKQDENIANINL